MTPDNDVYRGIRGWRNGRPFGERTARILHDQALFIEVGDRVALAMALGPEFCEEHVRLFTYACPQCQERRYA